MTDVAMVGPTQYDRIENDAYFTREPWVTEALLNTIDLRGPLWECAAGAGHMVRVLRQRGYQVLSSDITDHGFSLTEKKDFLAFETDWDGTIITNPPYSLQDEFIRHALEITAPKRGMVAMLLRHEFDCAKKRRPLIGGHFAFTMKITLLKRPRWVEGPQKASPRHNYAWFVWDWRRETPATIRWAA